MESGLLQSRLHTEAPTHRDQPRRLQGILFNRHCHCTTNTSSSQRLIPLTEEIILAMMDFNGSQSTTSISEKPFYSTFSITSLVREEVHNILHELSISDQFIRKEEIDDLIERCLKEKVAIVQEDDSKTTTISDSDTNQEIEVTVEMLNESGKNKLIVENFQILEQRITSLEERISTVLQTIPKLRHLQAKKFKINTAAIREELRQFMDKMELSEQLTAPEAAHTKGFATDALEVPIGPDTLDKDILYDDMFYEQRQNAFNLLSYKKSKATIELNQRAHLNPNVMPAKMEFPKQQFKTKQKPMFICSEM